MIKKWLADPKFRDLLVIALIILLNILPRLAYILSPGFFIDGDEAILGTAVQDLLNNHNLQVFLAGQNYGFVPFEVLAASALGLFFGVNIFSLKIAMLLFWLASVIILYYIGRKMFSDWRLSCLAVAFVSFIPVWFDWATKARIGYLTAFLFSNIVILLSLSKRNAVRIIGLSLSLVLIYYAQPLWLVIAAPFVVYYLVKDYRLKDTAIFTISTLIIWGASRLLLSAIDFNYQLQSRLGFDQLADNIQNIFHYYSVAYSGRFFDAAGLSLDSLAVSVSGLLVVMLGIAIVYNVYLASRRRIKRENALFLIVVVAYIVFMLLYDGERYHYRYLLPIFIPAAYLIVLTIEQLPSLKLKRYSYIFLTLYISMSLVSGLRSYVQVFPPLDDGYTEVERIESLGKFLRDNDINCVYALDWMTSQHIDYFLPDIIVRHQDIDPRRPQDSRQVDFLSRQSDDCALVGLWYQVSLFTSRYKLDEIFIINSRYVLHLRPQQEDLVKLQFKSAD